MHRNRCNTEQVTGYSYTDRNNMATSKSSSKRSLKRADRSKTQVLKTLCECPVCFEPFKDPRLLKCGHQFCEICLNDIAEHSKYGTIACPTCREVTKPAGGDVTTLPRSTLQQYMQVVIYWGPTEEALGQKCSKCKISKPVIHCQDCTADLAYLCDKCYGIHQRVQRFANHSTVKFDPALICREHPNKMVENFCRTCYTCVCVDCLFEGHSEHDTESVNPVAEAKREQLAKLLERTKTTLVKDTDISDIETCSCDLYKVRNVFRQKVTVIKDACKKVESKLDSLLVEFDSQISSEMERIDSFHGNIQQFSIAQNKVLQVAERLLKPEVSDAQVIMTSKDLQQPEVDFDSRLQLKVPTFEDTMFDSVAAQLDSITSKVDIGYEEICIKVDLPDAASKVLSKLHEIEFEQPPYGLKFVKDTYKLVCRIADLFAPIKIIDMNGVICQSYGQGLPALNPWTQCQQISYDPKRDLLLVPGSDGSLVRLEINGSVVDKAKLCAAIGDVCYIQSRDLYAVTDHDKGNIFLVSPETLTTVQIISGRSDSDSDSDSDSGTHEYPLHVSTGIIENTETLVVSDWDSGILTLYDSDGNTLTFMDGSDSEVLDGLSNVHGVAVDGEGRIVVCDKDNRRILRVWSDEKEEHWECILDAEQLEGGQPWDVDICVDNKLMAISLQHKNTLQIYKY